MNVLHTTPEPDWRELVSLAMRNAREALGISQVEMAQMLGCTQGLISKYENGSAIPPGDVIIHCIHIAGVSILSATLAPEVDSRWKAVLQALQALDEAIHSARQYMGAVAPNKKQSRERHGL